MAPETRPKRERREAPQFGWTEQQQACTGHWHGLGVTKLVNNKYMCVSFYLFPSFFCSHVWEREHVRLQIRKSQISHAPCNSNQGCHRPRWAMVRVMSDAQTQALATLNHLSVSHRVSTPSVIPPKRWRQEKFWTKIFSGQEGKRRKEKRLLAPIDPI